MNPDVIRQQLSALDPSFLATMKEFKAATDKADEKKEELKSRKAEVMAEFEANNFFLIEETEAALTEAEELKKKATNIVIDGLAKLREAGLVPDDKSSLFDGAIKVSDRSKWSIKEQFSNREIVSFLRTEFPHLLTYDEKELFKFAGTMESDEREKELPMVRRESNYTVSYLATFWKWLKLYGE